MTIICALHQNGETWIGADSRAVSGDCILAGGVRKWAVGPAAAIGANGNFLACQIIAQNANEILKDADPVAIADRTRSAIAERFSAADEKDGGARSYGFSMVIATPSGVWDADSSFAVVKISDGTLWARGSGRDYALGSGHSLGKFVSVSPEYRIIDAVDAACAFDVACGGERFVHRLGDPLP